MKSAKRTAAVLAAAVAALVCTGFVGDGAASGQGDERAASSALVCKVRLTQYDGKTEREAALPYAPLEDDGRSVTIRRVHGGDGPATVEVKESGPWNANDAYWRPESRRRWKNLPRCVSEAEAAYYRGYNGGEDQFGREVVNPASIEVTLAVARDLGLGRYENAWVYVEFPWVRR